MKYPALIPISTLVAMGCLLTSFSCAGEPAREVQIKIENHRFIPSRIEIPADAKVKLIIDNLDDSKEEFDSYDLNREAVVKGKSSTSFYIGPLSPGEYEFEGEFNPKTAQGKVIVK